MSRVVKTFPGKFQICQQVSLTHGQQMRQLKGMRKDKKYRRSEIIHLTGALHQAALQSSTIA